MFVTGEKFEAKWVGAYMAKSADNAETKEEGPNTSSIHMFSKDTEQANGKGNAPCLAEPVG